MDVALDRLGSFFGFVLAGGGAEGRGGGEARGGRGGVGGDGGGGGVDDDGVEGFDFAEAGVTREEWEQAAMELEATL